MLTQQIYTINSLNTTITMKKSMFLTKMLKSKGLKFGETSLELGFKSETWFRKSIDDGTLTPSRVCKLADILKIDEAHMLHFLSDDLLTDALPTAEEPLPMYRKSLGASTDPYELLGRLYEFRNELNDLLTTRTKPN